MKTDWCAVEREYRETRTSARELARRYDVSEAAIRKRAKAGEWTRPDPVSGPTVRTMPERRELCTDSPSAEPSELVQRGLNIILRLIDELDAVTLNIGELEEMIVAETVGDESPRRRSAMMQAVSLATRSTVAKNLAAALKTVQEGAGPMGKKDQQQQAAERAAGKFAPPAPPKLVVDNRR